MKRSRGAARRGTTWLWLAVALAVGALALVAAGCGGDDESSSGDTTGTETTAAGGECDSTIWVLLPDSATSPRWETDDRKYFEDAFTEAGVDFNIVNSEGSAVTQQSQAEQAIADGAEVIVVTSNDSGSGATIIDIAKEAGVKVVEYDRFNTGGAGGDAYVSFDNEEVGRKMAEVLEPEIDALDVDTPAVVMLNGGEEDNNSFQFRAGYAETVEERVDAGDWTLAADQHVPGWGANGEGQGIMEQILTDNNNEINGVFAANDNLAQQAINALEAAGVDGRTDQRPGRERCGHAEHRPRQADHEHLQAVLRPGQCRGGCRRRAVQRRGLRRGCDKLRVRPRVRRLLRLDHRNRHRVRRGHGVTRRRRIHPVRLTRPHRRDRGQHHGHRRRRRVPDNRGDLHRRHGQHGLLSGEQLNTQTGNGGGALSAPAPVLGGKDGSRDGPLIECRGVSRSFGAVQALYHVDFEVRYGEVMALVGDNGAGKSTLIKGIVGIYPFDEGTTVFEGAEVNIHGPRDAAHLGIEVVYQDLALADNLDVVANMFLGRERIHNVCMLNESSMEQASRAALDDLSVTTLKSVRQRVAGLSGGQRQAVAVAKSVMWDAKLVILDEPTAALGVAQTRQVLDLVRRLAEKGLGVVIVSHNLHDIFEVSDRITVLRLGQRVALFERAETNQQEVVHAITAGSIAAVPGMAGPDAIAT